MAVFVNQSEHTNEVTPTKSNKVALIILGILYFMMGFITCLNDTLVPLFKSGFDLSYAESSLVQFYFFLTYAIMSIPAGNIVERIGYKNGMVYGFILAAFGAFLFLPASLIHQYSLFLAALFILAIGIVLLQVSANPYITLLGSSETASSRLTLIQGIGSVGTTVAPLFGASFILNEVSNTNSNSESLAPVYLGIAVLLFLLGGMIYLIKMPKFSTQSNEDNLSSNAILGFRNLKFGIIAIFMYVGAEVTIGTFLTNYISSTIQISESEANFYVSFYWGGMLLGRFIGSIFLNIFKASNVLFVTTVVAILLIFISIFTDESISIWSLIAVGLCNSVMFAIIFSLSVKGLGNATTRASGLLSSAIVGGAIIPYVVGLLIDHVSWNWSFLLIILCYSYLLFYSLNGYKNSTKFSN